jgi:hypothetical protein
MAVLQLPLEKMDVKLTPRALVLRRNGATGRFLDDLAPALDAYRAGDYQRAVTSFSEQEAQYPTAVEIPFYRGVSRLFLNDVPGALADLRRARTLADDTLAPDITWYLAVADERSGDRAAARTELDTLCRGASAYAARACAAAAKF